jgi:hypothetical protein
MSEETVRRTFLIRTEEHPCLQGTFKGNLLSGAMPTDQLCHRFEQAPLAGLILWLISTRLSLNALACYRQLRLGGGQIRKDEPTFQDRVEFIAVQ